MEAALKEREKRLEEVKQAKSQKQEVSPTVLAYKKDGIKHSFLDEYDNK